MRNDNQARQIASLKVNWWSLKNNFVILILEVTCTYNIKKYVLICEYGEVEQQGDFSRAIY